MGKNSGGGSTGGGGGMSSAAREMASKYLGDIKDPKMKKELAETMAEFGKEFEIPDNLSITFKNFGDGTLGSVNGRNDMKLHSDMINGKMSVAQAKQTLAHELTHTIDRTDTHRSKNVDWKGTKPVLKSANKKFDKQLTAAYKTFKQRYGSEQTKKIGAYALTNKHEFFAEALSSHMTGTKTVYGDWAYKFAKSMTK